MSVFQSMLQRAVVAPAQAPTPPAPEPGLLPPVGPEPGLLPPSPPDVAPPFPPIEFDPRAFEDAMRAAEHARQFQFDFGDPWMHLPSELMPLVLGSLTLILLMIVGYPIARAIARRIDRPRADPLATLQPVDVMARLERIEQAVETMAVEIERISEGQRFTNRLFAERAKELGSRAVPAGQGEK